MAKEIDPAWGGGHGGGEETAAMLAIWPQAVHRERCRESTLKPLSENITTTGFKTVQFKGVTLTMPQPIAAICDNGWTGPDHPAAASASWGETMLEAISQLLVQLIDELKHIPLGEAHEVR